MTTKTPCCENCAPSKDIIPSMGEELKHLGKYGCWNDECECHTPQESWEETLLKEFGDEYNNVPGNMPIIKTGTNLLEIKRFIQKLLSTAHSQGVGEGRLSVLKDFDAVCKADVFMGFSPEEWLAVRKFFEVNKQISGWDTTDK